MCGITGYYKYNTFVNCIKEGSLLNAANQIAHRGPDDFGIIEHPKVGLAHRRLSIIDLSPTGHQPMISNDKRFTIVFNGEIYNYPELKKELINLGYTFRGTSDTETILYGFAHFGKSYIQRLNGIFALAIWDEQKEQLFIARDRLGVKPMYYFCDESVFLFGSEIKTLLSYGSIQRKVHPQSFHEFLFYGYALGENTLFEGIKKLLPGTILTISNEGNQFETFWTPNNALPIKTNISEKEAIDTTRILLDKAVQRQLISDVPVGVFLSGGIDSSAMLAFATKHYGSKIKTYSAGFDFNGGHNELPLAAKTAKQFGSEHQEFMIKGGDLPFIIEKLVEHHDEPFSDAANIPLYLMTQAVGEDCTVILQGDGGDELFGGYPRYHILEKYKQYKYGLTFAKLVFPFLPKGNLKTKIERFNEVFDEKEEGRMYAKFLTIESDKTTTPYEALSQKSNNLLAQTDPFSRYKLCTQAFSGLTEKAQKMLWIDTQIILPDQFLEKVDKSTMANSKEVRVPFLDNELVDFAMSLPAHLKLKNGVQKYILKKSLEGIVSDEVLYGKKMGFGVPYQNWLAAPLKTYMLGVFRSDYIRKQNIFNEEVLVNRVEEHSQGIKDHGFFLWKMLNFCLWLEKYKVTFE